MIAMEIAQSGFDLRRAADYQKTFSTLSASLLINDKLFIDVDHVNSTIGNSVPIYEHNLGYPPVHFIMRKVSSGSLQYYMGSNFNVSVDERYVYITSQGVSAANDTFFIVLFRRSITQEYTAEQGSLVSPLPTTVGAPVALRLVREGFKINTSDPREIIVDTDYKTMLVHKSGVISKTSADSIGYESVAHNLTYPPLHFVYFSYDSSNPDVGKFRQVLGAVGTGIVSGAHKVDNNNLYIYKTTNGRYAYLILKDPSL